MNKTDVKKQSIIEEVVNYLLKNGLAKIGIRRLAIAAGTSDRMLIYYFGTKDELIKQSLNLIAAGITDQLDDLLGSHPRPAQELLDELTIINSQEAYSPAIRLWFEIVGLAARGKEPYLSTAQVMVKEWTGWIETRLDNPAENKADDLYAHLEGRLMLKILEN